MNYYDKDDAVMTRGLAICNMVLLHLFCRKGPDVFGTPILWIKEGVPFVYWFGFFAGICVPLYSFCAGYAYQLLNQKGKTTYADTLKRAWKLVVNFWIVLTVFTLIGWIFGRTSGVPQNIREFIQQMFLIKYQNGAWWYLRSYFLIMMIPAALLLWPVKHIRGSALIALCYLITIGWYLVKRLNIMPDSVKDYFVVDMLLYKFRLPEVIPYFWIGAVFCKDDLMNKCAVFYNKIIPERYRNVLICSLVSLMFVVVNLIEKSVLLDFATVLTIIGFNIWSKPKTVKKVFLFLGKHSTNIWLTHMFFYFILFKGLVQQLRYPVLMFLALIALCVISSYVVIGIEKSIYEMFGKLKRTRG